MHFGMPDESVWLKETIDCAPIMYIICEKSILQWSLLLNAIVYAAVDGAVVAFISNGNVRERLTKW